MSNTKFTPGPWVRRYHANGVNYVSKLTDSEDDAAIASIGSMVFPDGCDTANAHLIAAAPEMYQALELCINAMPIAGDSEKQDKARIAAIDALAKARGES